MVLLEKTSSSPAGVPATASLTPSYCVPGSQSLKRRANEYIPNGTVKRLAHKFDQLERNNDEENFKPTDRKTVQPLPDLSASLNQLHRWAVLRTSLGCVWKDAMALFKLDQLIKEGFREGYYETVSQFVVEYGKILGEKDPIQTTDLDLDAMEQTLDLMQYFGRTYTQHKFRWLRENYHIPAAVPTAAESLRILRAFYRRTIFVRLYLMGHVDHDTFDRKTFLKNLFEQRFEKLLAKDWSRKDLQIFNGRLFGLFQPWELDQVMSVDFFILELVGLHTPYRQQPRETILEEYYPVLDAPITRLLYDLEFLREAAAFLPAGTKTTWRGPPHKWRISHNTGNYNYTYFALHCFLPDQQIRSYRCGYNSLTGSPGELQHLRTWFESAVNPPVAWLDAFSGRTPYCSAFGLALQPVRFKFKHHLDAPHHNIYPADDSPTRGAKVASQATPPQWRTSTSGADQSFEAFRESDGYNKWAMWCHLGFVMWDRYRAEALQQACRDPPYRVGWIGIDELLDVMVNAKVYV